MNSILDKEIDEATASIESQHTQCTWYVQTYLLAITGLFATAAFFAKDGYLSLQASSVGIIYSLVVFFLGWIFLSIIAHKVAMIHMLYKHIASMRDLRIRAHSEIVAAYVLPKGKAPTKYASLISFLPYLFFAFNFILFAGGMSYFLAPHNEYHQTVALVVAICIFFGTFYPVVCISFNKHLACAAKAKNMRHKQLLEISWTRAGRVRKNKNKIARNIALIIANSGAISVAIYSFALQSSASKRNVILLSYAGIVIFGVIRFWMEKKRQKVGSEAIRTPSGSPAIVSG